MSDKNIYQRINAVMKVVEYVQKDATITGGGTYKAVSHDMVVAVLRKEMVSQGIVVRLEQLKGHFEQKRDQKADIKMHLYVGEYAVHFVNIDNPDDCVSTTIQAHANDTGDKAPGKAASYAVKYAMLKTFSLETGENDEARFADPYTKEQLEIYHDLIDSEKAYDFYLFVATLPPETVTGLHNSFPDGKKTQGKRAAAALEEQGREKFRQVVEDVQQRIANHDVSVSEITDEMSPIEKRFLASRLSDFEVNQLKKITGKAA